MNEQANDFTGYEKERPPGGLSLLKEISTEIY